MSILADRLLTLRLAGRPEFLLRLEEFTVAYGLADKAALIVQARPHPDDPLPVLDVDDGALQKQFLAGSGSSSSWWGGFRSMTAARPTFHGIAGLSGSHDPSWASEMHVDGHFVAGVWKFPKLPLNGGDVTVVPDFFADFPGEFCSLVSALLQQSAVVQRYELTASLLGANKLRFAKPGDFGGTHQVVGRTLSQDNVQWPVLAVDNGSASWTAAGKRIGRMLAGIYGARP